MRIAGARIAYGGMAEIPTRARAAERTLIGALLDKPATWEPAIAALAEDFKPIDDQRASAAYRLDAAGAILRRTLAELAGAPTSRTRIVGRREAAHVG
jgi:xanthine dehydrogenase small subunit